jgi:hypothetical protein
LALAERALAVRLRRPRVLQPAHRRDLRPRDLRALRAREPGYGIMDPRYHSVVWYCTEVRLGPADRPPPGGRLLLHFGAVDYHTKVWAGGNWWSSTRAASPPFTPM